MVELKGSLDSASVPAIVQLIGELRHSGRLDLTNRSDQASLWFDEGHLIGASFGDQHGMRALVACVQAFSSGEFVFSERVPPGERTLDLGPDGLGAQLTRLGNSQGEAEPELGAATPPVGPPAQVSPGACPRLGFADDPTRHYSRPTALHRCFATGVGSTISSPEQRDLCLGGGYPTCPRYKSDTRATPAAPTTPTPAPAPPVMPSGVARRLAAANEMRVGNETAPPEASATVPQDTRTTERPRAHDAPPLDSSRSPLPDAGDIVPPGAPGRLSPDAPPRRTTPAVGPPPSRPAPREAMPPTVDADDKKPRSRRSLVLLASGAVLGLALLAVAALVLVPRLNRGLPTPPSASATQAPNAAPPTQADAAATAVRPIAAASPVASTAAAPSARPAGSTAPAVTVAGTAATPAGSAGGPAAAASVIAASPVASLAPGAANAGQPLIDVRFANTASSNWLENPPFAGFSDGAYRLQARQATRFVAVGAPVEQPLGDVVVSATFRKTGGPPGGGYGLIIRDQGPDPRDGVNQNLNAYVLEAGDRGRIRRLASRRRPLGRPGAVDALRQRARGRIAQRSDGARHWRSADLQRQRQRWSPPCRTTRCRRAVWVCSSAATTTKSPWTTSRFRFPTDRVPVAEVVQGDPAAHAPSVSGPGRRNARSRRRAGRHRRRLAPRAPRRPAYSARRSDPDRARRSLAPVAARTRQVSVVWDEAADQTLGYQTVDGQTHRARRLASLARIGDGAVQLVAETDDPAGGADRRRGARRSGRAPSA